METVEATAAQAIPYPSEKRAAAVEAIANYLRMLRDWTATRYAVAGDGGGTVALANRNSYIYARLGGADGDVIEAKLINLLEPENNDALLVRREHPGGAGGWLVLDWLGAGTPPLRSCLCRAQLTLVPASAGTLFVGNGAAVAVRGHFAYCMTPAVASTGGGTFNFNARLFTVDLSNPDAPSVAATQDLGETWYYVNVRVASDASKLWVSGALYDDPTTPNGTYRVARYDLTDPDAPTLDAVDDFILTETWGLFEQSGNVYLFGAYAIDIGGGNSEYRYGVVNGSTLAVEALYNPNDPPASGRYLSQDPYTHAEPLQIGDYVPIVYPVGPTPGYVVIGFLDLTTVAAPTLAWQDTEDAVAFCKLSDTEFYGLRGNGDEYLYDATNPGAVTKQALTEPAFYNGTGYFKFFGGDTVWQAALPNIGGGSFDNASTFIMFSNASSLVPERISYDSCFNPIYNTEIQKFGDSDAEGGVVYLCGVGLGDAGITLTLATGTL